MIERTTTEEELKERGYLTISELSIFHEVVLSITRLADRREAVGCDPKIINGRCYYSKKQQIEILKDYFKNDNKR